MKRRGVLLPASFLVTAMIFGVVGVASANAEEKCRDSMLHGLYVFTATGWTNLSPGPGVPVAIVELIRFNGDGTADAPGGRVSVGGSIFPTTSDATYTTPTPVDNGCESIIAFSSPPHPSLYLFIPHDAKTLQALQIRAGNVLQGPVTKLSH